MYAHARTDQSVCVVLEAPATKDTGALEVHINILDPSGERFAELDNLLPSNVPFSDLFEAFVAWVEDSRPEETRVTTDSQNFTFASGELVGFLSRYASHGSRASVKEVVRPQTKV